MKLFIRTLILCALVVFVSNGLFAGNYSVRPVSRLSPHFFHTVVKVDSVMSTKIAVPASRKICSCQILDLESSNYRHNNVAVFAEKTQNGDLSADTRVARQAIEKEKKHLRQLFYDKLKVVGHVAETSDCRSLYIKLRSADQSLVMYDILDADVRN